MFVSIHIPKCGGMSLRQMLSTGFGDRCQTDYGDKIHCYLPEYIEKRRIRKRQLKKQGAAAFDNVDIVHGHFYASKYTNLGITPEWVTFLRHPTTLLPSYFSFLQRKKKGVLAELARSMSGLDEFIEHPWFSNIMSRQLEGVPVEDFTFIGFVESYEDSSQQLTSLMGIPYRRYSRNTNRKSNVLASFDRSKSSSDGSKYPLTPNQLQMITELNADDIALYQAAQARFAKNLSVAQL